jgi:hypothetical protein
MDSYLDKKIDKYIKELYNITILKDLKIQIKTLQKPQTQWIKK